MQKLEQALRKNAIIMAILIVLLALLLLYAILVLGDVSSAKGKTERQYTEEIDGLNAEIEEIAQEEVEKREKIADYDQDIAERKDSIVDLVLAKYAEQ